MTKFRDLCVAIAAILISILSVPAIINGIVERHVNDRAFLEKLAAKIKPTMIIDSSGSILYDSGGSYYIEDPKIINLNENSEIYEITITGKKFLSTAPIIECINETYSIKVERGKGKSWIYKISFLPFISSGEGGQSGKDIFRLEMIP